MFFDKNSGAQKTHAPGDASGNDLWRWMENNSIDGNLNRKKGERN